jgi:signal recognition particle subunit SRP19
MNKSLKRREGRRLSLNEAIENPTLREIRLAAQKLELDFEIRKECSYPRQWWNPQGLILVEKKKSKLSTIRELSNEIEQNIRPALEKKKKEFIKEAKKKKVIRSGSKEPSKKQVKDFRPKRRR